MKTLEGTILVAMVVVTECLAFPTNTPESPIYFDCIATNGEIGVCYTYRKSHDDCSFFRGKSSGPREKLQPFLREIACRRPTILCCPYSMYQPVECDPKCENDGICSATNNCTCVGSWTGTTCETRVCDPKCENGGTCSAPKNCTCTVSWTGTTCGVKRCGHVNRAPERIVGGNATEVNEYPWMVGLAASSTSPRPFCGASIIHNSFVLTAAHCVKNMDGTEVVVVGEHKWSTSDESNRIVVNIAEIYKHENYSQETKENDIAIVKLSVPLSFGTDNKVAPICPPEAGNLYPESAAIVTGWGTTQSNGTLSDTLQEVNVPTMPNLICKDKYANTKFQITDDMICAGQYEGGKDSCQGDSGGPLITYDPSLSYYMQIGVVSWGDGCAKAGRPGVYARVTKKLKWIESKMKESKWINTNSFP